MIALLRSLIEQMYANTDVGMLLFNIDDGVKLSIFYQK